MSSVAITPRMSRSLFLTMSRCIDYNFNGISNPGWSVSIQAFGLTPQCGYSGQAAATQVTLDYFNSTSGDYNGDGHPDLVWQNNSTAQVTVHYYGGAQGNIDQGWNWLNSTGDPGWKLVGSGDFDGNGRAGPGVVKTTLQVTVNYFGGADGTTCIWLGLAEQGRRAGLDGSRGGGHGPQWNSTDLIWQNDTTNQVTVNYYGGTGEGAVYQGWNWLEQRWRAGGLAGSRGGGL